MRILLLFFLPHARLTGRAGYLEILWLISLRKLLNFIIELQQISQYKG
jgi:hypothetical protein